MVLPNCTNVGENIWVHDGATLKLPNCSSVGGTVWASDGATIELPNCNNVGMDVIACRDATINLLSFTNVGGEIWADENATINMPGKRNYHLSTGVVYGYEYNNTIYLTPEGINPNTTIHEYAHLWAKAMQVANPALWTHIKNVLKASDGWTTISENADYSFLHADEDRLAGEVLATTVGDNAEKLLIEIANKSLDGSDDDNRQIHAVIDELKNRISEYVTKDIFELSEEEYHLNVNTLTLGVLYSLVEQKQLNLTSSIMATNEKQLNLSEMSFEQVHALASNSTTPSDILQQLVSYYANTSEIDNIDGEIFYALAKNPSILPADLKRLREIVVSMGANWDPTEPVENIISEINNNWKNKILDFRTNQTKNLISGYNGNPAIDTTDGEIAFYELQALMVNLKDDKETRRELRESDNAEVRSFIHRMDLAEDIAFESVLGGDRFDRKDIPYMVSNAGLTQKDITEFRDMTRHLIGTMGDNDEKGEIKQFYLDILNGYWMPTIEKALESEFEDIISIEKSQKDSKMIFLLGGHDLEMEEIKKLLDENGVHYLMEDYSIDDWLTLGNTFLLNLHEIYGIESSDSEATILGVFKQMSWDASDDMDDARYKSEFDEDEDDIEWDEYALAKKEKEVADGLIDRLQHGDISYNLIDHHNEYSDRKSSIEQVADIIGVQLNRHQQLVAANDRGYIPAMKEMGATDEEIAEIRRLDRQAQGVTPEEEQIATEVLRLGETALNGNGLFVYRVPDEMTHFSPITDVNYSIPMIVYNANEICYYGPLAHGLGDEFASLVKSGKAYFGGAAEWGFFGTSQRAVDTVDFLKENLHKFAGTDRESLWTKLNEDYTSERFLCDFRDLISEKCPVIADFLIKYESFCAAKPNHCRSISYLHLKDAQHSFCEMAYGEKTLSSLGQENEKVCIITDPLSDVWSINRQGKRAASFNTRTGKVQLHKPCVSESSSLKKH